MRRFAALLAALDTGRDDAARQTALQAYLAEVDVADAAWGLFLLLGGRPPRAIPAAALRAEIQRAAGLPDWLFEASQKVVGELAETLAQLLPPPRQPDDPGLAVWLGQRLPRLQATPADQQSAEWLTWCGGLPVGARTLLLQLIAGSLRLDLQPLLVQRALARHGGLAEGLVALRLPGWADRRRPPSADRLAALLAPSATPAEAAGQPLARTPPQPLEVGAADKLASDLGDAGDWLPTWQHGGQRAQIVRRAGGVWIWRGDGALLHAGLPELMQVARQLPEGTVLDGELLAWREGDAAPLPPAQLQRRLDRRTLDRRLLAELPLRFVAGDLLEWAGEDLRGCALRHRREALERLFDPHWPAAQGADGPLQLSRQLPADNWPAMLALRAQARDRGLDGLLLRRLDSACGDADGGGWILRDPPRSVVAVLVYAQAGTGRGGGAATDYSFALWSRPPADAAEAEAAVRAIGRGEPPAPGALRLVTVARTGLGLAPAEHQALASLVRASTLAKFGPVRSLLPQRVIELGFEGVDRSARRSSGISLRAPCMRRIRHDLQLHEVDTLTSLHRMLPPDSWGAGLQ